ncbi:MAG: hypothetical protein KU29_13070 [Sulfurovum sp. FS06-10]|jgi:predicted ATPase|nr:MAG: hypothetical protein KU29_13070 [Sulfurovum sp. FS06-10]
MELQLKNIGMIKEANVKLDGLTVIAGENDTGKSTVGKALYLYLHTLNSNKNANSLAQSVFGYGLSPSDNPEIGIDKKDKDYQVIFVETPLIWNFTDFFRDIAQVESQMQIELDYPYLMKDLNFKLHIKKASDGINIKDKMTVLMGGEFKKDEMGRYYFDKHGKKIELVNTATGIKMFGIFQVLSQNNYLNENTVLVLDEPEVHLHPKWQLEMAKLIVELVKNGVSILVNSHSPYMIEALKRYSDREKIQAKTNFYLAEDGKIDKVKESNSQTLVAIYEKLSEPYDVFEEMESERFQNG